MSGISWVSGIFLVSGIFWVWLGGGGGGSHGLGLEGVSGLRVRGGKCRNISRVLV